MRLSKLALMTIRGGGREMKEKLSSVLGASLPTIYKWIAENDDNLTKAAALQFIREETGLTDEQILEEPKGVVSKPELNGEVKV